MKRNAIRVPLESWIYLQDICKSQRCGDHLSEKTIERLTNEYNNHYKENWHLLLDGDLGGAIGNPINSYEEHRWTSWKVEEMKKMLDKANLPYKDNEPMETINCKI